MNQHALMLYMAADNELNPYGKINDLTEIRKAQISTSAWPLSVQFHSPQEDQEGTHGGILSLAFKKGHEIAHKRVVDSVNTGRPEFLNSFLDWSDNILECEKKSLIIWGHGTGPIDIESQSEIITKSIAFDYTDDDALTTNELVSSLEKYLNGKKFSFIGFDACYMASIEVATELSPFCNFIVSSEGPVPEIGWPYEIILHKLSMSNTEDDLECTKIINDNFLTLFSPSKPACISTIDCDMLFSTLEPIKKLVDVILVRISEPQVFVYIYRSLSPNRITRFGEAIIDLCNFLENIIKFFPTDDSISIAAINALDKVRDSIVWSTSQGYDNANGISIMFPPSKISETISKNYSNLNFCKQTGWDKLLDAFHKGGE